MVSKRLNKLIPTIQDMEELVSEVLWWAKSPGDHGGNPYIKDFVKLAVKIEETLNND